MSHFVSQPDGVTHILGRRLSWLLPKLRVLSSLFLPKHLVFFQTILCLKCKKFIINYCQPVIQYPQTITNVSKLYNCDGTSHVIFHDMLLKGNFVIFEYIFSPYHLVVGVKSCFRFSEE